MRLVYLDNAATTQVDPEVVQAMMPFLTEHYGNPSSIHSLGRITRTAIEQARKTVASLINAAPSEIFFTSGGTEANNMAICRSIEDLNIKHAITSGIEHHAVLHTLEALSKEGKIKLSLVALDEQGKVDLAHLRYLLETNERSLVSLMHANNEIATRLPIHEAARLVKEFNGIFHSDTVQTMGHFKIDVQQTPVDFLNCAAHKFHGPKGVGFIYIRSGTGIHPFIHGGAQERNMRGGTENLAGIVGLSKALEISCQHMDEHAQHIRGIKSYMMEQLQHTFSDLRFNGDVSDDSLYTVLNVSFAPSDAGEMLLFSLDINGIAASGGSACSSGSEVGSHVLAAIGATAGRNNVRFSFSKYTTRDDIDYTIETLKKLLPELVSTAHV
ncbi:MAG: cysteine desulfurase family protein [Bacteroidia bacterium]|jgi:cysteine desulfurase